MNIREAKDHDRDAIRLVHLDAFGQVEGPVVAKLALDLLTDETAKPVLALVAKERGAIVGSIVFSSVTIRGQEYLAAYILAPLAVAKAAQGRGIGLALIRHGIGMIKERGADLVLVLGDPRYYTRSGFSSAHSIQPPYELEHPQAWMAREIKQGVLGKVEGAVVCSVSLSAPEHW